MQLSGGDGLNPAKSRGPMPKIALKVRKLPILAKLLQDSVIIERSTDNPRVPGNTEALARFVAAQEKLDATAAEYMTLQQTCKQKLTTRNDAVAEWLASLSGLAYVTEAVTGDDAVACLSAGFVLCAEASPTAALVAPNPVRVETNGRPGRTKVSCAPLAGAVAYVVEGCAGPLSEDVWVQLAIGTSASFEVDGAEPGQRYWFRLAGVNALGLGTWSEPALRPVL